MIRRSEDVKVSSRPASDDPAWGRPTMDVKAIRREERMTLRLQARAARDVAITNKKSDSSNDDNDASLSSIESYSDSFIGYGQMAADIMNHESSSEYSSYKSESSSSESASAVNDIPNMLS